MKKFISCLFIIVFFIFSYNLSVQGTYGLINSEADEALINSEEMGSDILTIIKSRCAISSNVKESSKTKQIAFATYLYYNSNNKIYSIGNGENDPITIDVNNLLGDQSNSSEWNTFIEDQQSNNQTDMKLKIFIMGSYNDYGNFFTTYFIYDSLEDFTLDNMEFNDEGVNPFKEEKLPLGTRIGLFVLKGLHNFVLGLSDGIQGLLEEVAFFGEEGKGILFSYSELVDDEFVNVRRDNEKSYNNQKYVPIKKTYKGERYIDKNGEESEIPNIRCDTYGFAMGTVDALDVNFFTPRKNHSDAWKYVRGVIISIIRMVIFISFACLIANLIWNGLVLVVATLNPIARRNHIEGLQRFGISLFILVGTVLIMMLGIYASEMMLETVTANKSDIESGISEKEYPIRIYVEETGYSFSTTIIGYARYKAGVQEESFQVERTRYIIAYLVLVLINGLIFLAMLGRVLAMMLYAVIGPIAAVLTAFRVERLPFFQFRQMTIHFLLWMSIPVIISILYRISLETVK